MAKATQWGRWVIGAVVATAAVWPVQAWAQALDLPASGERSRELEVGYSGWLMGEDSRHQVMAGVVFRNTSPVALVVRGTGSSAPNNAHLTSAVGSYTREGTQRLLTLGGGVRLEGRMPRATVSLQVLAGGAMSRNRTRTILDDKFGRRESFSDRSSVALLAEISAGLQVKVTDRVGVFGRAGVTGPLLHPMYYRMPSVTGGVTISY